MTATPQPDSRGDGQAVDIGQVLREYMDVTRRLQCTHETLQREVLRLRHELESKDRELELRRRLASLGELAAGVAHEVRNPLGAIQLYSGLLRSECRQLAPAQKLLDKIEAGIRAIDDVVQDTLALAPRPCRLERRPLAEIVQRAADFCLNVFHRRGVTLDVELSPPELQVVADTEAMARVLVNLLANAAEVARAGTIVRLRACGDEAGNTRISVLDEGPGLPPEVLDRVFDPFFTTKEHGTGLGLTIAHRLVEAHGGELTARNRTGQGAEFIITIPSGADRHSSETGQAAGCCDAA